MLFVFAVAEFIIRPIGEFSLNDDFAYARSVYFWDKTGVFEIGNWPAMSLFSHALLGLAFVKIFGFSFTVLRFANMALCLATLFYLYRFILKYHSSTVSALICGFVVFNPYYMNLFNSYMTDLTFCNFSFLSFYFLHSYYKSKKNHKLILFFVFSTLATLVRQPGIALFFSFFIVALLDYFKNKNVFPLAISILFFLGGLIILFFFEVKIFGRGSVPENYQSLFFSKSDNPSWDNKQHPELSSLILGENALQNLVGKAIRILKFSGSLFLPLFILFFPIFKKRFVECNKFVFFAGTFIFLIALFAINNKAVTGDIVIDLGLGIESTVDRLYIGTNVQHGSAPILFDSLIVLFVIGYLLFLSYVFSAQFRNFFSLKPTLQYLVFVAMGYLILISIAESSFDRYCMFFAFFILVFLVQKKYTHSRSSLILSVVVCILIGTFSVLATKDYFTAARLKKRIRTELITSLKIPDPEINSSGEHQFWDKTLSDFNWVNWDHYNDKKYLITRGPIPQFETFKIYTYRRFVPCGTDTFFVLKKSDKNLN